MRVRASWTKEERRSQRPARHPRPGQPSTRHHRRFEPVSPRPVRDPTQTRADCRLSRSPGSVPRHGMSIFGSNDHRSKRRGREVSGTREACPGRRRSSQPVSLTRLASSLDLLLSEKIVVLTKIKSPMAHKSLHASTNRQGYQPLLTLCHGSRRSGCWWATLRSDPAVVRVSGRGDFEARGRTCRRSLMIPLGMFHAAGEANPKHPDRR